MYLVLFKVWLWHPIQQ